MKPHLRLSPLNDSIPYADFVGLTLYEDTQGLLTVLKENRDNIGNEIIGAVHGGVVAGLMEHAASFHLLDALGEEAVPPRIINISVDYLRPALHHATYARAQIIKQGKRIANVRVTAWQKDENRPVATARAHFFVA
ncbi:PaaI family thioesterase [Terasakiella sp. SH-1]|uniref:PaaI family thioesterase n=1 Tax=Terasakiella sp. SH-1 TaxID=2560057 RepID=UPI00107399F2|nr:PaaI family thioesterase [Terasakiella sp. SH-1]